MHAWSEGYFTDSHYTYGYFPALSPVQQRFALLINGLEAPPPDDTPVHCELGFGQGVSLNVHAASNPGQYIGTDFTPAQAVHAMSLARRGGNDNARILDDSFAAFLQRQDLPQCDTISLHGIWSWVNDDNRATLLDILQRCLKPGGIVYLSHNCLPGWSNIQPLQKLLALHDKHYGNGQSANARVDGAIDFMHQLFATRPAYVQAAGEVLDAQLKLLKQNRAYLAHEYLNDNWQAPYFIDVANALSGIRVDFACSTNLLRRLDALYLTTQQRELLSGVAAAPLREQLFDYCTNERFRADLYVRGALTLSPETQRMRLLDQEVVLCVPPDQVSFKVSTHLGEFAPHDNQYDCVSAALSADGGSPKRIGDVLVQAQQHGLEESRAMRAIITLAGNGHLQACQDSAAQQQVAARCAQFNRAVCDMAQEDDLVAILASPVTGAGISGLGRSERLFTLAQLQGKDPVSFAWEQLQRMDATLVSNGREIADAAAGQAELQRQHATYRKVWQPLLTALGALAQTS